MISVPPKERSGIIYAPKFHAVLLNSKYKDKTCNEREESYYFIDIRRSN